VADANLPMRVCRPPVAAGVPGQGFDSFPVESLGQSHGVSAGLAEVCVVEEPVILRDDVKAVAVEQGSGCPGASSGPVHVWRSGSTFAV
jgi:hypothetical protein